jgi:hypothetical protein
MKFSELPIVHFARGVTLLAILIVIPVIAICWNFLPKSSTQKAVQQPTVPVTESTQSFSVFTSEAIPTASPVVAESRESVRENAGSPSVWTPPDAAIQQVSWDQSHMELQPRPELPHDFESLKLRLQTLGVRNYKLEKWGNRGELFRCSCFATPPQPYRYAKFFDATDPDELAAIKKVIADIEQWKNVR